MRIFDWLFKKRSSEEQKLAKLKARSHKEGISSKERDTIFQQLADLYLNGKRTLICAEALQELVLQLERLIQLPEVSGVSATVMNALVKALADTTPNNKIGSSLADWLAEELGFAARHGKRPFLDTLAFSKGSDALIATLSERLRDRSSRKRSYVMIFLCELRDERCRSILTELAQDEDDLVAGNAKLGLSKLPS
ncbi:MAG: hypothetical protein PHD13_05855 [Methanocellales archaeon]|nr:hypothetical protein [Methanocellales archaeon]MDD3292037.1 hypothetical protein [Methanocellales archaeon]MDD5235680.1 hypothetical protein [Methanocellales archaeon]MDD5485606.1 hypothetical protein [Methanocellales archaeon]